MISILHRRSWLLLLPLLAVGTAAEAAQYTPSQIPIPSSSGFGQLDDSLPFESTAYFRGSKSTSGGVGTYTLQASTRASNVGMKGSNKTLTWWADADHSFTVNRGVWDLNFRGKATGTASGLPVSGSSCNNPSTCSNTVSVYGTGISGSASDMSWLQSNMPGVYDAFTSSSTNRNLFSAKLTAFDLFGESTSTMSDDAIAFRWTNATGALAPFADPMNYVYLGNVKTSSFLGRSGSYSTTKAIQHTNVPVPGAAYLFGSALLWLGRMGIAGRRRLRA